MSTTELDASVERKQAVAKQLRSLRINSNYESPESAAAAVVAAGGKITPSYLRRIERGEHSPSIDVLSVLCAAYNTTLARFFASLDLDGNGKRRRA